MLYNPEWDHPRQPSQEPKSVPRHLLDIAGELAFCFIPVSFLFGFVLLPAGLMPCGDGPHWGVSLWGASMLAYAYLACKYFKL